MKMRGPLGLLTATHVVNDFYVGAVPALLPYFAVERDYGYAAVGGVLLAATLLSCVVLPGFGILSDRRRLWWMVPGGMLTAGVGVGLSGLVDSYLFTCLALVLSGVGVAAYHPEAAKAARATAGESTKGMSLFSVGGNIGLALGPFGVALVIGFTGLAGTILLALPAVALAAVYVAARPRSVPASEASDATNRARPAGTDDWRSFGILVAVIIARAIGSVGTGSFVALYLIAEFDRSPSDGALVLGVFSGFGVLGTLYGGWLADRVGRVTALRTTYVIAPAAMAGVILLPAYPFALAATALLGFSWFMPFAVQLVLGQDYLPNRHGTASGVTLGFSITAAGLFTPLLGSIADAHSLTVALWLGCAALFAGLVFALMLPRISQHQTDNDSKDTGGTHDKASIRPGDGSSLLERNQDGGAGLRLRSGGPRRNGG
ncbi:MAG TPA: MFS transporter [Nocardioidaceae bacterium]|nr:MFS transporter [Nocardioidaceae bacterium]